MHVESTAIDGEGSRTQADAFFRVHLKDGSEAIVYTLLEHRSQVDHRTPLQLIRYTLNVWAIEIDSGAFPDGGLPLVIPMVFFHGPEPWTAPCSIEETIDAPEGLEHLAQIFGRYVLHDLGRIASQELSHGAGVRAALDRTCSDTEAGLLAAGVPKTEFGRHLLTYIFEHRRPVARTHQSCFLVRRNGPDNGGESHGNRRTDLD
ncbi:MAG: Rpn family recombination-promoting nuclease/putative transposase [Rhodobacteraceae bacterium]|nr:Rpn family recombination-promoting nuclease/putative transposase [Paracoccaceae bacterium]